MRILHLTDCYDNFLESTPVNDSLSFQENETNFYSHCFSWADFWIEPMARRGIHFWQITSNHEQLQRIWAREFLTKNAFSDPKAIVAAQVSRFKPDILFMDTYDELLLDSLRTACKSIKMVATWTGSAVAPKNWIKKVDVTLSCAPEVVEKLRLMGHKAEHLDHMFAPKVLEAIKGRQLMRREKATFIGQLLPGSEFHRARINLVSSLIPLGLKVFSPPWSSRTHLNFFRSKLSYRSTDVTWTDYMRLQYARRPGCFGLDMYTTLANSDVTINVHADSSPKFASNMRLYEATGVGTCLLTDWKDNITNLFEPDHEVVTYRTAEECKEKLNFLLANPRAREQIAKNGQKRCLAEHNIDRRTDKMLEIFRKYL
jgi:spore maturation protein CgeB